MSEYKGIIERWDDDKGFGFISSPQNKKIFFHISVVRGTFRPLQGEVVLFQLGSDARGRATATHVRSENLTLDNPRIRIKHATKNVRADSARPKTVHIANSKNKFRLYESKIPWGYLLPLLILPAIGVGDLAVNHQSPWGILLYVVASLCTYYFYWDDKRRAKRNEWRIPEANLHFWAIIGGWPGAFIAQQQFRHKTKKFPFQLVFWLVVISHQLLWFDWLVMDGKWLLLLQG